MTTLSCEGIREAAGIKDIVLPDHLYLGQRYDKWGNQILKNGTRLPGELFQDESVQKILKQGNVLSDFITKVKYARTYHLPWSPGKTRDDRQMENVEIFEGKRVIITEKRDGENTTIYNDNPPHARSLDSENDPSIKWVKNFWAQHFAYQQKIPDGWRICGENLYIRHSIPYNDLDTYFEAFSIWDDRNVCLDWDTTVEWAELLDLKLVPVIYDGIWDMGVIDSLNKIFKLGYDKMEGYVVRVADEFHYSQFRKYVGKYVRSNHVHQHGKSVHIKMDRYRTNSLK